MDAAIAAVALAHADQGVEQFVAHGVGQRRAGIGDAGRGAVDVLAQGNACPAVVGAEAAGVVDQFVERLHDQFGGAVQGDARFVHVYFEAARGEQGAVGLAGFAHECAEVEFFRLGAGDGLFDAAGFAHGAHQGAEAFDAAARSLEVGM